jgi:signal recognition particle receptor subunit beta
MSLINHNVKEIHCKVVYYGPSLGGKTTNIQWIYDQTDQGQRSKLMSMNTENERTIFFDFYPLSIGEIRGFKTRLHLYSVPGQMSFDKTRKFILRGLDGVVFVADSQAERMEENKEALKNLEANLTQAGYDIKQLPLVIQYNKRDLPNALSIGEMRAALNPYNAPDFEAVAADGSGVMESLTTVTKKIVTLLKGGEV